jgi:uncharacterized OsmC-like protein
MAISLLNVTAFRPNFRQGLADESGQREIRSHLYLRPQGRRKASHFINNVGMGLVSRVRYVGALRTETEHLASGQQGLTDAPTDNQGRGEAFSPTDLVATSLASCMLTIMGISARDRGWQLEGTQAMVTKTMASNPRRISAIHIDMVVPGQWEEKARSILVQAAKTCPVAMSLHPDIVQDLHIQWGVHADQPGTSVAG